MAINFFRMPFSTCVVALMALSAQAYEGGIQIAESLPKGVQGLDEWQTSMDDCASLGYAVELRDARGNYEKIYDKNGQQCTKAHDVFDGRLAVNQRAPAPSAVSIDFLQDDMAKSVVYHDRGELIAGDADSRWEVEPAAGQDWVVSTLPSTSFKKTSDPVMETVQKWTGAQAATQVESEHLLAGLRSHERISQNGFVVGQQAHIDSLRAQLREAERRQSFEAELHDRMNTGIANAEAENEAIAMKWQSRTDSLRDQIDLLQSRLKTTEAQQQRTAERARADRDMLVNQVARLSSQLGQGSGSHFYRKQVVEDINKALQMGAGAVGLGLDGGRPFASRDIAELPVVVQAENMTLRDLLQYLTSKLGDKWHVRWDLDPQHDYILHEPWRLIAEDTFNNIMEHVAQRVQADYGVPLTFTYFDANNLVIISDLQPTGVSVSGF